MPAARLISQHAEAKRSAQHAIMMKHERREIYFHADSPLHKHSPHDRSAPWASAIIELFIWHRNKEVIDGAIGQARSRLA